MGGVSEPTSRVYWNVNTEECVEYWRKKMDLPPLIWFPAYYSGCVNRQAYIFFDCHGKPLERSTERFMGDELKHYYPELLWADGKYKIREKMRTKFPEGVPIYEHNEWDMKRECCPPDWMRDIAGEKGVPD